MRKFKVINNLTSTYGLKIGDVVTLVEGSVENDLYELPKYLHGKGHKADMYDLHLNLKENNYIYLSELDLEEIKVENNIISAINIFSKMYPEYEIITVQLWDQHYDYVTYRIQATQDNDVIIDIIRIDL